MYRHRSLIQNWLCILLLKNCSLSWLFTLFQISHGHWWQRDLMTLIFWCESKLWQMMTSSSACLLRVQNTVGSQCITLKKCWAKWSRSISFICCLSYCYIHLNTHSIWISLYIANTWQKIWQWKIECFTQLGFTSLNGAFQFFISWNICAITIINTHYLYDATHDMKLTCV